MNSKKKKKNIHVSTSNGSPCFSNTKACPNIGLDVEKSLEVT